MSVYPIPTTRSSDMLARTRALSQLTDDQLAMLQLQTQLSTGRRIQTPSEDPTAALRAQGVQRLLELKSQISTNLKSTQSFLSASDTAVSSVSDLLAEARGIAVSNAGTTSSPTERQAAATQIDRILQQITGSGNQQFRGRYLFAGSRTTVQPFTVTNGLIAYNGNQGTIRSFADDALLFDANLDGNSMFGAISDQQQSKVDLNPVLTSDTRLADLNGGRGITSGSIAISDGTTKRTIDISGAETIGDVAALLESQPPTGRTVTARVGPKGLEISLNAAGGGLLTVSEVGGGTTAAELGIKSAASIGTGPLVGGELNPIVRSTTNLADLLGVRGTATLKTTGTNNDLVIASKHNGPGDNGTSIQYVDDSLLHASPGLTAGNETVAYNATAVPAQAAVTFSGTGNNLLLTGSAAGTSLNGVRIVVDGAGSIGNAAQVSYDAAGKVLHLGVDSSGGTQVQTLVNAINAQGTFAAAPDGSNAADGAYSATSTIAAADVGVVSGSTGNSGAEANTFRVYVQPSGTTANQAVAALSNDATFSARFTAKLDSKDTSSPAFAGLGLVGAAASASTIGGSGVDLDLQSGLQIRNASETHVIDVSSAKTVEDLLNIVNGSSANVLAEVNETGTGINIRSRISGTDLTIGENGGTTATQLGVRSLSATTTLAELNYGAGVHPAGGTDFTIHRNDGTNLDINLSSATTIGDVVDLINNNPANADPNTRVVARLAQFGNGIELVDDNPTAGLSLSITQAFGSHAAEELGLVAKGATTSNATLAATPATASLAFPAANYVNTGLTLTGLTAGTGLNGVNVVFQSTLSGDTATAAFDATTKTLTVSLDATQTTASTIRNAINSEGTFNAALNTTSDPTNDGSGIVGATGAVGTTAGGTAERLTGSDQNSIEVKGVFTALIRLRDALNANDTVALSRASGLLDDSTDKLNFSRGEIGARGQAIDSLTTRQEDEQLELQKTLSDEIDVDPAKAISEFLARQASYQASLQLSGKLFQLSLLNYL